MVATQITFSRILRILLVTKCFNMNYDVVVHLKEVLEHFVHVMLRRRTTMKTKLTGLTKETTTWP